MATGESRENLELDGKLKIDSFGNVTIDHSPVRFEMKGALGKGTYGSVYRALDTKVSQMVAIKIAKWKTHDGIPSSVLREMAVLQQLSHPNIVKFLDVVLDTDRATIVMELMDMDLHTYIHSPQYCPTVMGSLQLMQQLLKGIEHMHKMGIIHRDLKPQNLLVHQDTRTLKISDFGIARSVQVLMPPYTPEVVTLFYRAPEILLGTKIYTHAVDMWSAGCIFAELMLRKPLFEAGSEIEAIKRVFELLGTPTEATWPGYSDLENVKKINVPKYVASSDNFTKRIPMLKGEVNPIILLQDLLHCCPTKRISAHLALATAFEHPRMDSVLSG